jgi:hypothetical protein
MGELAGDQVDDGHQVPQRAKAARSGNGYLDLGVDRLGGGVGQAGAEAADDTGQVLAQSRAKVLERR